MFCAESYNIFARSLGSACIPWVMHISEEWRREIEAQVAVPFSEWVKVTLTAEYKNHFHKNYNCGNKNGMRSLWSMRIRSSADMPANLSGVEFVAEDRVGYTAGGELVIATTLHGLLVQYIGARAEELYMHIVKDEEHYLWESRGPKIYNSIVGVVPSLGRSPDIVVLTEYDIHEAAADYRGSGQCERFCDAMRAGGYGGALMQAPLDRELSGLGLYWKDAEFELHAHESDMAEDMGSGEGGIFKLGSGCSHRGAYNFDLHEHCHALRRGADGAVSSGYREIHIADRKNVFFVRLQHKASGKIVLVIGLHLTTDSRDCVDTNEFPGEVRGQELNTIGNILIENPAISEGVDALLMMGDFNIDVSERGILKGDLKSFLTSAELSINTRFSDTADEKNPIFDLNQKGESPPYQKHFRLVEAFSGVHKWEAGSELCSSYNSKRRSWIDMVWHSDSSLRALRTGEVRPLRNPIPNADHGSDHIPLYVLFQFC